MTKRYNVPVNNPKLTGPEYKESQEWIIEGYLRGLTDLKIAKRAEFIPNNDKDAQTSILEIELEDYVGKSVAVTIDKTLKEVYNAKPQKVLKKKKSSKASRNQDKYKVK